MDYAAFLGLIKARRSIHRFKPDPVPAEYVDKIIEAARWAPSGGNIQPWEFIVVSKPELKNRITQLYQEHMALAYRMELTREPAWRFPPMAKPLKEPLDLAGAPLFIILCGDPRTNAARPLSVELEATSVFDSNLASAFLYMHLAATSLGLGSRWVSPVSNPYLQVQIKHLLGIPDELKVYDMMAVGFAALVPKPRLVRARDEMVHHDRFDRTKFRTPDQIRDFIARLYAWRREA
ncbi:MAG: nitroreductase family protein [Chloroflexota bacterium]